MVRPRGTGAVSLFYMGRAGSLFDMGRVPHIQAPSRPFMANVNMQCQLRTGGWTSLLIVRRLPRHGCALTICGSLVCIWAHHEAFKGVHPLPGCVRPLPCLRGAISRTTHSKEFSYRRVNSFSKRESHNQRRERETLGAKSSSFLHAQL